MEDIKYRNSVDFEVMGDYAMFSDPSLRIGGSKFSYRVPTYEALKGILKNIYWQPAFIWVIDKVRIMNEIQTQSKGIRTISYCDDESDLFSYSYLVDCRYQVRAHFVWNENRPELMADWNENKHYNIAKRMIAKGGRRNVFLGTSECQGYVNPCIFGEGKGYYDDEPEITFGQMYHGITYADEAYSDATKGKMTIRLWDATMEKGIIYFIHPRECKHRQGREMYMKKYDAESGNNSLVDNQEVVA